MPDAGTGPAQGAGTMPGLDDAITVSAAVRRSDLNHFLGLLRGASAVAERCRDDIESCGPAHETFQVLMARIPAIRALYADLSPVEKDKIWLEVASLFEEARALRQVVARRDAVQTLRPPPPPAPAELALAS